MSLRIQKKYIEASKKPCARKNIKIDLTDQSFLVLAQEAHKRDITFNQLAEALLRQEVDRMEKVKRV